MSLSSIQKPFIKWVGGKTQIMDDLLNKFPKQMNNYHELFLGGGSVLLAVLSLQQHGHITIKQQVYAYDLNEKLINVYKCIQSIPNELCDMIDSIKEEYKSIIKFNINTENLDKDAKLLFLKKMRNPQTKSEALTSKESYYYWIRVKFNTVDITNIESAAYFIFLNKIGFRGMYREGPKGFNIPFGNYKKTPEIANKTEFNKISQLISNVKFIHCSYTSSIQKIEAYDFVYLDPPYAPESLTSFVGYVGDGFSIDDHKDLFDKTKMLSGKNIKFVMSNSKTDMVVDYFKGFNIDDIIARRAINSKNPGSKTTEVFIYN